MTTLEEALIAKLTGLADDELVLSHRNAEWVGHAPILEEDIALANLAQDELGHATLWLSVRGALDGSDADRLAYFRDAAEFRSSRFVEMPRGDWAFTLLRQFLFDAYEALWLDAAKDSAHVPLRDVAQKMLREEKFHLRHTKIWVERLGLGTEESNRRTQAALDVLWPLAAQLFVEIPGEDLLLQAGYVPNLADVREKWTALVTAHLQASGLTVPTTTPPAFSRQEHSEHLAPMLREMQEVARADETALSW
ncbi:1,2-phenylacetyl-CoA epoxidase subunit PaaC [Deinococcus yavapaiensis]|uniref:Ring-1,2-phenylacetyl-CoA epoxidase subunit PaaC n=1 Tax=Deinococcus yavapaiensis KR-236 TaxID=694435 RepID=A0A318SBT7_9DEIO|nr:1,2-phenylacetyl-CoA epoxidase subunit PaaC [Deinococcus yavapaiensis]PYE55824.1 ring-1,2-phenylacetyl-CoA epoxidase subunit PaaC [Deinococcus yavapaiensis KR-236]